LLKKKGKDEQAEAEANSKKGLKSKDGRENKFGAKGFDGRDRQGLRGVSNDGDEFSHWRKRKSKDRKAQEEEDTTIRPTQLKIRLPISIKDLAAEMKLKASQLLSKLFLQGMVITLNDLLDDDTVVQLLGQEFGCEITIDTSEEERIRITNQTIKQEVASSAPEQLVPRAPVVTFMGHVDHGKTSLIDAIRKSNRVSTEAGAITQHIGAFRCTTSVGDIAILDTPGHEAFSAMRARGASVTDIVVLVISGEEGMKPQTIEAIRQAREAQATIVVAINKCDKPNFNVETVYRQLAEQELLPEAWGGSTITVNCSAVTGEGIPELLEMVALQSEVLELKANLNTRARGTVIESEMHKGLGAIARILVQNGTLRHGDAVVFDYQWGKVKTMHDEYNNSIQEAGPSTPVAITGLAGLPKAGDEFVVVANEREAREIAEARLEGMKEKLALQKQAFSMEHLMQHASNIEKKVFNLILRTDVQGSLDALKTALSKIKSDKIKLEIISAGVGEVSESDVEMAATSKSVILGFHTRIESHAEEVIKEQGIQVKMHDIIYHAVDDIITLMTDKLDKIPEEHDRGLVEVRAVFKSSQVGIIAGCYVTEGSIIRSHSVRVIRDKEVVWKGSISSLKRVKEDVREVQKGFECGIVLNGFNEIKEGDQIQSYEVVYRTQTL
jgi:translation initiation factor IF-2